MIAGNMIISIAALSIGPLFAIGWTILIIVCDLRAPPR